MIYKTFVILFGLVILSSCANNDKEAFKVTYDFKFISEDTCKVLIIYKDSIDYISFCTDKNWSKDVSLSRKDMASLLIIPQVYYKTGQNSIGDNSLFPSNNILLKGQIIHKKKTITANGKDNINIALFPKDL